MANELMNLLGGIMAGIGAGRERNTQEQYKKSLIDHIKTQAKLDQQKIEMLGAQGYLEQQKFEEAKKLLAYGMGGQVPPDMNLPPKKAYPGMNIPGQPGSITEIPAPQTGAMPPEQKPGIIGMIQRLIGGQSRQVGQSQGGYGAIQKVLGGGVIPQGQAEQMAAPSNIQGIIQRTAQQEGLPPHLLASIIKQESNFNPQAVSPKGAVGLMQLMPETAAGMGVDPTNPEQNVAGGARFLKAMLQKYNGNLPMALAAYNWGPGNLDKYGPQNMPAETKNYIASIMGNMQQPQQRQGLLAPITGKLTSGWDARRDDGARQHASGDFAAPAGTPFVAPTNLQVTQVRPQMSNSSGGMVWGVDQNGIEHRMLHVNPGAIKVGDMVQAGQPLGTVYDMKNPHLHYQQVDTRTGQPINFMAGQGPQAGGQVTQSVGPQTGPGGRPLISQRDAMSIALQQLTGAKLPDGKTPLKIDTGSEIMVVSPDNPNEVWARIPKTPDTVTVSRTDDKGQTWNEYYTQPRPNQPAQFLGKISTSPNAYQSGLTKGTEELGKNLVAGMPPEEAGKINLVRNALERVQEAKNLLFKDGKINREMLLKGLVTGPGGAGVGSAREFYSKMYQTLDAALRLETGAQATPGEIQTKMKEFYPSNLDDDKTIKSKMKDLESYISGLPGLMKGKQVFSGKEKPEAADQSQGKQIVDTGTHKGRKVVKYSDGTIEYAD